MLFSSKRCQSLIMNPILCSSTVFMLQALVKFLRYVETWNHHKGKATVAAVLALLREWPCPEVHTLCVYITYFEVHTFCVYITYSHCCLVVCVFLHRRSGLLHVNDVFVLGGSLALETLVLLQYCEQQGHGPFAVSGASLGGHVSFFWLCE